MPLGDFNRPHSDRPPDDGPALLPYARPGTPCDGGSSPAHRLQERRGALDLEKALREIYSRGKAVPGGACGFWGACGAGISAGQFLAIATESTPLAREPWGLSNRMTASALDSIGSVGGPRCCKRDSFLAILAAVDFAREHLGVEMERTVPVCSYSALNNQCIGRRCPFSAAGR